MNSFELLGLNIKIEPEVNFRKIAQTCNLDYYGEDNFLKRQLIIFKKYKWLISPTLARRVDSVYSENFYGCLGVFIFSKEKYILTHIAPSTFWDDTEKKQFFDQLLNKVDELQDKFSILLFASRLEYFTEARFQKYFNSTIELIDTLSKRLEFYTQIKAKGSGKNATHFFYNAENDSATVYQN